MFAILKKSGIFEKPQPHVRPADYELLGEMRKIGHQPFIMLRINEAMGHRSHLVCETQNEAPRFVHEIMERDLAGHPLVYAIDKALRLEADDAARALFSWITRNDGHPRVRVLRGLSALDRLWCDFYVGYPVLDIDCTVEAFDSANARLAAALEFVKGYVEVPGNEHLRAALVEAFALGIARAGGSPPTLEVKSHTL